jgi:hypothetical protein
MLDSEHSCEGGDMAKFEINKAALDALGRQAVDQFNKKMQPVLDGVHRDCAGLPVDQIKPILSSRWTAGGGEALPAAELTKWATEISNGRRIVLRNAG